MQNTHSRSMIAERVSDLMQDQKPKIRFKRMVHRWQASLGEKASLPLPLPGDRDLSLEEKYTVLAAFYDTEPLGEKIDPWPDPMKNTVIRRRIKKLGGGLKYMEFETLKAGIPYEVLKREAKECHSLHRLTQILEQVMTDIAVEQDEFVSHNEVTNGNAVTALPRKDIHGKLEADDQFVFIPHGDGFYIEGFGESGHVKKTRGFEYILKIISSTKSGMPMASLTGADKDQRLTSDSHSKQPEIDEQARNEIERRLLELSDDRKKAERENNPMEIAACDEEHKKLESQIRRATGLGGKSRDLNNPLDKLRPSIHGALNRAHKKLRDARPPMIRVAEHFESNISSASGCFVYHPAKPSPKWSFDLPSEK